MLEEANGYRTIMTMSQPSPLLPYLGFEESHQTLASLLGCKRQWPRGPLLNTPRPYSR